MNIFLQKGTIKWKKKLNRNLNLLKKILKKPYTWGFYRVVFLLVIPPLIWIIYYIGDNGYIFINTSLTVGVELGLYGSFLTFIVTVFLGFIAKIKKCIN